MLSYYTYGKKILQGLVNYTWADTSSGRTHVDVNFPSYIFLGFSITEPIINSDWESYYYGQVSNFTSPSCGGTYQSDGQTITETGTYAKQDLTKKGPNNRGIFAAPSMEQIVYYPTTDSGAGPSQTKYVGYIKNQEAIMFPYTGKTTEPHSGYHNAEGTPSNIIYFGLFDNYSATSPYLWGKLNEPVSVPSNVIPIILPGDIKFTLG